MLKEQVELSQSLETSNFCVRIHDACQARGYTYLPIIIALALMFGVTIWQVFLPATDPARYQCYAISFWGGKQALNQLPPEQCAFLHNVTPARFHALPLEYPPLTLVPFSLPLLVPPHYYQLAFALIMSVCMLIVYRLLLQYGARGSAVAFSIYMVFGSLALAQMRFDLISALLTLLCVIAAERKHWKYAYIALAFGTLIKIYPILLLPSLFITEQRSKGLFYTPPTNLTLSQIPSQLYKTLREWRHWQWINCFLFVGIVIIVTGLFTLSDFYGAVVSQIEYFLQRPLQIESTPATLLWLTHLAGMPWHVFFSFGSVDIDGPLKNIVSALFTTCFILGTITILYIQWRNKLRFVQVATALTLVFIVTGKVFSPQYLIWLIPLLAYEGVFNQFWLRAWGLLFLLTTFIYAYFYIQLPTYQQLPDPQHVMIPAGFFTTAMLRNILIVLLTIIYLFNWFNLRTNASDNNYILFSNKKTTWPQ